VVASKSGHAQFNQTRTILDSLRDRVERHHVMIQHLKAQRANFDEQLQIMDTIDQHSALRRELDKTREEKRRLTALRDEMEQQNRAWLRDVNQIHGRERRDVVEQIALVEKQRDEAQAFLDLVKARYEEDYSEALKEVGAVTTHLNKVLDFARRSLENAGRDAEKMHAMARSSAARRVKYEAAARRVGGAFDRSDGGAGRPRRAGDAEDDVCDPRVYDSSTEIARFLQTKTSALEEWLISRTQFTQQDRERYLTRVEEVKTKRAEFVDNEGELGQQLEALSSRIETREADFRRIREENVKIRKNLNVEHERVHDEAQERALVDELAAIHREIAEGHNRKLDWAKRLYPREHELHLSRHQIGLLQVELGELKILLENVKHHEEIDDLAQDAEALKAIAGGAKRKRPTRSDSPLGREEIE
jgi:hypothetical protein